MSLGGGAAASEAAVNDLVTQGLAALGVTLRDFDGPVVVVPMSLAILENRLDVNGDGFVSPRDALIVINLLNQIGPGTVDDVWQRLNGLAGGEGESGAYFDVNRDDYLSPRDALLIVNELNHASGEGEFAGRASKQYAGREYRRTEFGHGHGCRGVRQRAVGGVLQLVRFPGKLASSDFGRTVRRDGPPRSIINDDRAVRSHATGTTPSQSRSSRPASS